MFQPLRSKPEGNVCGVEPVPRRGLEPAGKRLPVRPHLEEDRVSERDWKSMAAIHVGRESASQRQESAALDTSVYWYQGGAGLQRCLENSQDPLPSE